VTLKSVSSTATSVLGIPATAGAATGSSATNAADASAAACAPVTPGTAGAATRKGAAGMSFVQLLTQSATTNGGTEVSAKTTESPPQEKSATKDDESGSDSVAMALAMVSQSLAQAASAATTTTAAAGGSVSAAKSDTAQIPAALAAAAKVASAAAAAGTVATGAAGTGTAAGASGPGAAASADDSDAADGADGSVATAQKLFALLMQGGDAGLGKMASKDAQSADASQNNSQTNQDTGPTVNSSTANAHLSVGSHFSLQHTNEAKATVDVKSPVGSTAWADELGGKITWMTHQGIESASLRLSPAHLGPVEVRISVQDGGASVWFGAAQADTRAALEQALPRLREMFSTQGLTLADANVSRDPPRQQQQQTATHSVVGVTGVTEVSGAHSSSSLSSLRIGLLDTYA